jgi:Uma2 family endonuclease
MHHEAMSNAMAIRDDRYTWKDYRSWPDDERWEIIGGEAHAMSPAPTTRHQLLVARLTRKWANFLEKKPCEVFPAPTDLKLSDTDVVQPDLLVVCEPDKIKPTHIEGPPALVIEILSPSTELLDRGRKLDLYAASGVKEVWLVTPYPSLLEIFVLDNGSYRRAHAFTREQPFHCPSFPALSLDLNALFDFPLAPEERINVVREGRPPYAARPAAAPGTP